MYVYKFVVFWGLIFGFSDAFTINCGEDVNQLVSMYPSFLGDTVEDIFPTRVGDEVFDWDAVRTVISTVNVSDVVNGRDLSTSGYIIA
jgi:hypothetical protein